MTWVFTESYPMSIKVGHRKENVTEVYYNTLQQQNRREKTGCGLTHLKMCKSGL